MTPRSAPPETGSGLRILVVRPDRLGDVILSTPVFEVIKHHYSRSQLTVMVRENVVPVVRGLESVSNVLIYDPEGRHAGIRGFFNLLREIRQGKFRIAVVLQSNLKIAAAVFFARIRYRVGPRSKPHSYLFYNRSVRQRRSKVEMHEADYNLQLLRKLGIRVGSRNVPTRVSVSEEMRKAAFEDLKAKGWDGKAQIIAVHPGMGGSALNWPETHYVDFIRLLLRDDRKVLLTGGPSEQALLERVRDALGSYRDQVWIYGGAQAGSVEGLGAVFSHASLVVAPSTGPLHLAVALGRPVLTFYPPIRVQSAIRWGPYVRDEAKASILVPEVYCGQDFSCLGNLCNYYPCMKGLTVTEALEKANRQLARTDSP